MMHLLFLFNLLQDSDNFEVELKFELHSHPHFGGDGFALWFINNMDNSITSNDPEAINGPIFGMTRNFKGVGVVFDTYDNDSKRNNPAIYVIHNESGAFNFAHDQDFEEDMVKTVPTHIDLPNQSHKCVADIRNINRPARALVKYLNKVLFVYIDTEDGQGWRFCLAVEINRGQADAGRTTLRGAHMALTAATGQVADNMDVLEVTTRYLRSSDSVADLAELDALAGSSSRGGLSNLVRFVTGILCIGLFVYSAYEFQEYKNMVTNHIDAVAVAYRMNQNTYALAYAHLAMCVLALVSMQFFLLIVNLPLLIIRYTLHAKGVLMLSPAMVTRMGNTGSGILGLSPEMRFYITLGTLGMSTLMYVYTFLFG